MKHLQLVCAVFLALAICTQVHTANAKKTFSAHQEIRVLVVPETETVLSTALSGHINTLKVNMGDSFKKGQVLMALDCELHQAELNKALAELESAQKILDVNRRLNQFNSVSELELALSESKVKIAQSEIKLRQAIVKRCTLKAPFNGKVVQRMARPYEFVAEGQPVIKILDNIHLRLQMFIPSQWSSHIHKGMTIKVTMDETGKSYTARISRMGSEVDAKSQTLEAWAVFKTAHPDLLAGMSGTAHFNSPTPE